MDTKARIAAVIIAIATTGSVEWQAEQHTAEAPAPQAAPALTDAASATFVFHGATPAQAEEMLWAIERFRTTGLDLPSLEIYFADGCQERFGAFGRFSMTSAAPPWRIEVCTTGVYLHELAHAWDGYNLTEADRRAFLDLRQLEAWGGSETPWAERGQEQLAQLVDWVLRQGILNHPSEAQLKDLDHFERVTGVPPPVIRLVDSPATVGDDHPAGPGATWSDGADPETVDRTSEYGY